MSTAGPIVANSLLVANGTSYADLLERRGPTLPKGAHLPERSVTLSVTFGFSPKG